jgi:hypothetical protein
VDSWLFHSLSDATTFTWSLKHSLLQSNLVARNETSILTLSSEPFICQSILHSVPRPPPSSRQQWPYVRLVNHLGLHSWLSGWIALSRPPKSQPQAVHRPTPSAKTENVDSVASSMSFGFCYLACLLHFRAHLRASALAVQDQTVKHF